jgi:hypothetical protein
MQYPTFRTLCLLSFSILVLIFASGGCKVDGSVFLPYQQPPKAVTNPNPADGAVDVPVDQVLSWESESDSLIYAVYLGTSPLIPVVSFQNSTSFDPPVLQYDTVYYWRVDTSNSKGITKGPAWQFTTGISPGLPPTIDPIANQAATVNEAFELDVAIAGNVQDDRDDISDLVFEVTSGSGSFTGSLYQNTFTSTGNQTVEFSITDLNGLQTDSSFVVDVQSPPPPNQPPAIDLIPDQIALENVLFSLDLAPYLSDDCDSVHKLTLKVTSGGGSFSGSLYTNTFSTPGNVTVGFRVTDTDNASTESSFLVSITAPTGYLYVDGTNGDDLDDGLSWTTAFRSIQRALDIAADGEMVIVADGIYTGDCNTNLDFADKSIHLKSENGSVACIIDCEQSGCGLYFFHGETGIAIVEGITIENGYAYEAGGIYCQGGTYLTIISCVIRNCYSEQFGGGMYCARSPFPINGLEPKVRISNTSIINNEAWNAGGGIRIEAVSDIVVSNCIIDNNVCGFGGGVHSLSSSAVFSNCSITNNISNIGGGIVVQDSTFILSNSTVKGNFANNASLGGGGIYCSNGASLIISSCNITYNNAYRGGGIYVQGLFASTIISIEETEVAYNCAADSGGGLYFREGGFNIINSEIINNRSGGDGGGGGIYCWNCDGDYLISDCLIQSNAAEELGQGGGLYLMFCSGLTIENSSIINNSAKENGGVYQDGCDNISIINCIIENNTP